MSVYLHDIPLIDAQNALEKALRDANLWQTLSSETISLDETALGRVLSEPIWALRSSPHYHASAMDGFAVRADETAGAAPVTPVLLALADQAKYVDTGDPLPDWANAVIPIENVEPIDPLGAIAADARKPESIRIRASVVPWSHGR